MVLEPNVFGYLTIRPIPVRGTTVRLNGRKLALPVRFRKVIPGRHVVEVTNDSLPTKKRTMTIEIPPDGKVTREVNLLK